MSTEFTLLRKAGDANDLSSVNIELSVTESSTRFSLDVYKTHPTIQEAFEHDCLFEGLSSEQLEHLAVRLLHIASIQSDNDVALLKRYNLPMHDPRNVPLEL